MNALQVGQEVVIHDVNEARSGGPARGIVTKIGRTLVTIKDSYGREVKYGVDDQCVRDNYGNSWFKTLDQEAVAAQREADMATLAASGFKLDGHARPTDADLHSVAELLRTVPDA